ncbi:macro domain-containing protein [Thermoanaerobacterium sp. R66]|uniref:macro domain-containing protein n=1 Tax=Thermoanaerobacterium sp. R66 TaxID=2742479 RepID=UPI002380829C|nr:macro domain-containing protein [Thermoanaerobacterium sp. R66]MDE4541251.1 hypothetical protein [Thermoanaerobacterium sp. R66]
MNKFLKISFTWALSIISMVFTFVPEASFEGCKLIKDASNKVNVILNRLLTFITIFVIVVIAHAIYRCVRRSICIKGHGYSIVIEYGDILKKENCKRVINFDECFTTSVGDEPSDVKRSSICGQYLTANPIHNMQALIEKAQLKPAKGKSRYQGKVRYESGRLVPNGDDLLMAFAKLDEDGRGCFFSREEFLDCLSILWNEIDKYYGQKDVCIPILGSGITRFEDKLLTKQELLDIIVASYKLSSHKIKPPFQLHIVCKKSDDFSLNRIGEKL